MRFTRCSPDLRAVSGSAAETSRVHSAALAWNLFEETFLLSLQLAVKFTDRQGFKN